MVYEEFEVRVDDNTIDRCLKNFHFTLTQVTLVPERRNCERTINLREVYASDFNSYFLNYDDKNLIFIVEVGFSVSTRTKRGRSRIGTSVYVNTSSIRSRNISVISASNKYGIIDHVINNTPVNGENFKSYLRHLKNKCNEIGITEDIFYHG
jgi:ribosomal protein S21